MYSSAKSGCHLSSSPLKHRDEEEEKEAKIHPVYFVWEMRVGGSGLAVVPCDRAEILGGLFYHKVEQESKERIESLTMDLSCSGLMNMKNDEENKRSTQY